MYKLVALDIDGTTFNNEHRITEEVKKSIFNAIDKGIKVVFISGREEHTVKELLTALDIDTYYGALNGSIISKTYFSKPEIVKYLDKKYVMEVIELIELSNLSPIVFTEDYIFTKNTNDEYINIISNFINPKINGVKSIISYIEENNLQDKILKIGICNEYDTLRLLEKELKYKYDDKYTFSFSLPFFLEIMGRNSDKGEALKIICELNNIDVKESIAIGDGENDIPMFKVSGLSIAMGNAMENVKNVSDFITDSNEQDGVAKAIDKFVGSKYD